MTSWTVLDIPSQESRSAIVTGTGGLGYETALVLARAGGDVVLAGRNPEKGAASVAKIKAAVPSARIAFEAIDLASLASVEAFADRMSAQRDALDLLVNNAGVMMPPDRQITADGFELQFGVNYLGHFALTARLLRLLRKGRRPRVVSLSSLAHRGGKIDFDDPQSDRNYRPMASYAQSKLAILIFALELQRRSDAGGWGLTSNAAHPGYARTDLIANGLGTDRLAVRLGRAIFEPLVSQSSAQGALPVLFAATAADAVGGGYYGPDGFLELNGAPRSARIMAHAKDEEVAARLWTLSERLTGVTMTPDAALAGSGA